MNHSRRPLALDLFCGGGGAALGIMQAGFEVVGIDLEPHPNYPGEFVQGDALDPQLSLEGFDLVWASPPCQRFSASTRAGPGGRERADRHPDLIPATRSLLAGHPFTIIENVPGAPIRPDVVLTGPTLGLRRIERRRHFEVSFPILQPPLQHLPRSAWESGEAITVTTSLCSLSHFHRRKAAGKPGRVPVREACEAMGIDIPMTAREVGEAVPPAYAFFLASWAMSLIRSRTDPRGQSTR